MLVKTDHGSPLFIGNAAFTVVKVPSGHAGLNFDFNPKFGVDTVIISEKFDAFIERLENVKS